jgi:hypothetical protein
METMPIPGQSLTRPEGNLSCTACHRKAPSASRKHIRMPLSPLTAGSRGRSLLVPINTLPPEMTGPPKAREPSSATHLTFFWAPGLTDQVVGMPRSTRLTRFREGEPPNIGQPRGGGAGAQGVSAGLTPKANRAANAAALRRAARARRQCV